MELNKKNIKILLFLIACTVLMTAIAFNIGAVMEALGFALSLVSFIFIGMAIAFVLNAPMRLIEKHLLRQYNKKKRKMSIRMLRPISLVLTIILILGLLFFVIFMVIPELARTIALLAEQIPQFLSEANTWAIELFERYGRSSDGLSIPTIDWVKVGDTALDLLSSGMGDLVTGTFNAATSVISVVVNFVVGIVLAMYMLMQKEKLVSQAKRFLYAFLSEKVVDKLIDIGRLANETFTSFIGGQFLEAMILGSLCFIGMSVLGFPFAAMIAALVCVTAFIPIFGAFLGLITGAFMIMVNQSFLEALGFVVFFFLLQQVENNFIYPHVVGKSVMLSGLWVMISVTLGGNIAGILGMIISVPLCSVVYALMREIINWRTKVRGIPAEKLQIDK